MNDATLDAMITKVRMNSKFFDGAHVARDPPMSNERIAQFEASCKIRLHPQYRRFLLTYGAGHFLYSHVYSVDPGSEWSLWRQSEGLPGVGKSLLPFSDNGCGDYLVFKVVDGNCLECPHWADHELGFTLAKSEYPDFNTFIAEAALMA